MQRLVGIYDADAGLAGELRYVAGRLAGRHCSLCDITHGALGKKKGFRSCEARLPAPLELVHRNERDPALVAASDGRLPGVFALVDGGWVVVLAPGDLAPLHGDVDAFERALDAAWARLTAT